MKNILDEIKSKAKALQKTIVLCEGEDSRVVKAAADATKEGVAKIVLLGNEAEIKATNPQIDLTGVTIINPLTSDKLPLYTQTLCELRKSKGMTSEQAAELLKDGTYFGAMMLKMGDVDGLVSGACHSTANTLRPGLQIIKTAPGVSSVSSFNLMICPAQGNEYCPDGLVIFADCGLNPTYTSEGLADCDALVTLTGVDELNMIISLYGGSRKLPQVITKLSHMGSRSIIDSLALGSIVCPKELCCNNIVRYVRAMRNQTGAAMSLHAIADGQAEAVEFLVDEHTMHCGQPLKDLKLKPNVLIASITHGAKAQVPSGNSVFVKGDSLVVVTSGRGVLQQLNDIFA